MFLDSSRAVWDASGNIIRYQGTLVDITEKRTMERQLAQQEEFRRRLLESFPDLILVVDLEERYTFVSSRVARSAGLPAGRHVGQKDFRACRIILRNWRPCTATLSPARELSDPRNTGRGIAMEAGAPCGLPAAALVMRKAKLGGVIISVRDITMETKAGTADRAERAPGGDGSDDWRRRPRTEQSADQHPGRERTAAGQPRPPSPRASSLRCCSSRRGAPRRSCRT